MEEEYELDDEEIDEENLLLAVIALIKRVRRLEEQMKQKNDMWSKWAQKIIILLLGVLLFVLGYKELVSWLMS